MCSVVEEERKIDNTLSCQWTPFLIKVIDQEITA